jgi:hypothetical protein
LINRSMKIRLSKSGYKSLSGLGFYRKIGTKSTSRSVRTVGILALKQTFEKFTDGSNLI